MSRRSALAITAVLLATAAAAAPASAAIDPDVAVDPNGHASFAWTAYLGERTLAQERRRTAAGTFEDGQFISPTGGDARRVRVAVAPDGTATYVWLRSGGFGRTVAQTRRRAPDGALSAVQTLSGTSTNAHNPRVALAPDGTAIFGWGTVSDDGVGFGPAQARSRAPNGSLSQVQTLGPSGESASGPELVVGADGVATFGWLTFDGSTARNQTRRRLPNGAFGIVRDLAAADELSAPRLAVDPAGRVTFVWTESTPTSFYGIQARRQLVSGTLEPVQNVTAGGPHATDPQVAVAADGTAAYAWIRGDGAGGVIQTRRKPSGGALTVPATLTPAGDVADEPRIAIAPDGVTTFLWRHTVSGGTRLETRRRLANGTFDATRGVSPLGASAQHGDLALGPGATTHFVWDEGSDEATAVVRTRRRTPAGLGATTTDLSG